MEQAALAKLSAIIPQISEVPGLGHLPEAAVMAAHKQVPLTSIRYNPAKIIFLIPDYLLCPGAATGFTLPSDRYLPSTRCSMPALIMCRKHLPCLWNMLLRILFNARRPPLRVLDLCAAPGGKSTLLASLLREEDLLISNEVIQTRASILAENLTRWGQMNTWVTNNDPKDFAKLPGYFDVMLIDAPCTGSGLWRKDADALDEWSVEHVKLCSERQKGY